MKNILIVFTTIVLGLAYGWCIVHYPIMAQQSWHKSSRVEWG
jgi:hypothetical protein